MKYLIWGIFIVAVVVVIIFLSSGMSGGAIDTAASISIPPPTNYLVDEAGVLDAATVVRLNSELESFDTNSKNTAQIGVLIVTSTQPDTIEQYSIAVADSWKVGYKGSDNGILFTLATNDRQTRIEVGKGFEGTLTDIQAEDILQQYAVPHFHTQDWSGGVEATVDALINQLNKK